jgi:3-hydroxyacyl-[acyl-carrier-protein] dehydratase
VKLKGDFFKILDSSVSKEGSVTTIALNPEHIVYKGHFPGFPVTPAVIQLQIVHELSEHQTGKKLKLEQLIQAKFLKVLNPEESSRIMVVIEFKEMEENLYVKARGENDADKYFRFQAVFAFS